MGHPNRYSVRVFTLGGGRCRESTGAATTLYAGAKPTASPRMPFALSSGESIPETRVKRTVLPGRVVAGSMSTANRCDPSVRMSAAAVARLPCVGSWLNPRSAIPHVTTTIVAAPSAARSPPCPTIRRVFDTASHYQIGLPILSRPCLLRGPTCSRTDFFCLACKVPSRRGNSDAERTTPGLTDPKPEAASQTSQPTLNPATTGAPR